MSVEAIAADVELTLAQSGFDKPVTLTGGAFVGALGLRHETGFALFFGLALLLLAVALFLLAVR